MGRGANEVSPPQLAELYQRSNREKAPRNADDAEKKSVAPSTKRKEPEVKYPDYFKNSLTFMLVFLMGATIRADWIFFFVNYRKSHGLDFYGAPLDESKAEQTVWQSDNGTDLAWNEAISKFVEVRLANFWDVAIPAYIVSYIMYFGIGGFFHWRYYYNRRDSPEEWKCQPRHWLSPELELHEIVIGASSLTLSATVTCLVACYITNGGYSTLYYTAGEYGYLWFLLQWPAIFIYQDYLTYWMHRVYHWPWLYKNFHKLHHTYKQPTAFSVTAIHPFEILHIYTIYISPLFLFPVHYVPYCSILMYTYYHGIVDHSGINFKRQWWQPWQPDCIFHDNHHQYFHVNFGFNIELWDKLHGTYRQKDRVYTEDIFYGVGKKLSDATQAEIQQDLIERVSENPLAYQDNKLQFDFSEEEKQKLLAASKSK